MRGPLMLTALLGLEPDGLCGRLRATAGVGRLDLKGLRVGRSMVDLLFECGADERISVAGGRIEGDLRVVPG
jgi:hypothetical protein